MIGREMELVKIDITPIKSNTSLPGLCKSSSVLRENDMETHVHKYNTAPARTLRYYKSKRNRRPEMHIENKHTAHRTNRAMKQGWSFIRDIYDIR
jgi:hypothetical protein